MISAHIINERKIPTIRPRNAIAQEIDSILVRPAGFEPATYGFVVRRSIRAELRARLLFDKNDVNRTISFTCQLVSTHKRHLSSRVSALVLCNPRRRATSPAVAKSLRPWWESKSIISGRTLIMKISGNLNNPPSQ